MMTNQMMGGLAQRHEHAIIRRRSLPIRRVAEERRMKNDGMAAQQEA